MKIEKVNDHQIRCTLTREDLADRELKLSELAYGTEKAKDLFRDMMQQASYEFGFEAEDIPLMIEAIPLNADCIVLIITKVEDPEELDTRFSKFAPSVHEDEDEVDDLLDTLTEGTDDVLDFFKRIQSKASQAAKDASTEQQPADSDEKHKSKDAPASSRSTGLTKLFSFSSLRNAAKAARLLSGSYTGKSSLFKTSDQAYILVISGITHTPAEINKICNILSEYATPVKAVNASEAYLEEHFEAIIKDTALASLSCM
ncbi:MAG: adaptor protein MecA [Lachnospiraceae bacterium]|nr:adaptor protein MecA [Lachnospiraceae bacterium]